MIPARSSPVGALRFGDCRLDLDARELRRGGEPVALSPRAFELLKLLIEGRPRAFSHHELRDALWPDTHVGYTSLAQVVAEIRRAIGDSASAPAMVRTIPRFGYAFVADVRVEPPREPVLAGLLVAEDREYPVASGETLIGRGTECGIRLVSSRVSRVHARLRADANGVTVEDAGSKNGTWVNGERRDAPTLLRDGDEIVLGHCRLVFQCVDVNGSTRTLAGPARTTSVRAGRERP